MLNDVLDEKTLKLYKCWKCGNEILSYSKPIICTQPMLALNRICAGSYELIIKSMDKKEESK